MTQLQLTRATSVGLYADGKRIVMSTFMGDKLRGTFKVVAILENGIWDVVNKRIFNHLIRYRHKEFTEALKQTKIN